MPAPLCIPLPTRRASVRLGQALASAVAPGDLVILVGELGAGKTFLVRAALRALGVPHEERVTSPTFALVHEYAARLAVAHVDLYRLGDPGELAPLGLRDLRARGTTLFVEWGAPHAQDLGGDALTVRILLPAEGVAGREARLEASGARSEALAQATRAALMRDRTHGRGG